MVHGTGSWCVREKVFGDNSRSIVDTESRQGKVRISVLHELYNEVDNLVFVHGLQVRVGNQEADVIALLRMSKPFA